MNIPEKHNPNGHKKQHILQRETLDFEMNLPIDLKLKETENLIEAALKYFSFIDIDGIKKTNCYVSSSYGKDSGLNVYLIKKCCDKLKIQMIPILLANTLNLYPEEIKFWKTFNHRYGLEPFFKQFLPPKDESGKQITVHTIREKNQQMENFRNKNQKQWNPKTQRFIIQTEPNCCKALKFTTLNQWLESNEGKNIVCSFDGRRAEENENRSRLILQKCRSFETSHKRPRKFRVILPLGMWRDIDVNKFHKDNFIPINPAYKNHNLKRMGCRNCVAFKNWIVDQATDPTGLRTNDLLMNIQAMEKFDVQRLQLELNFAVKKLKRLKETLVIEKGALKILNDYSVKYGIIKKTLQACKIKTFK